MDGYGSKYKTWIETEPKSFIIEKSFHTRHEYAMFEWQCHDGCNSVQECQQCKAKISEISHVYDKDSVHGYCTSSECTETHSNKNLCEENIKFCHFVFKYNKYKLYIIYIMYYYYRYIKHL